MNERMPYLRKKSMSLPLTPGVYLMKNKKGEIIYVGKAKALKNRVSTYFGSQNNHGIKVRKMVENVEDFDYIMCDSEFEALILECSLIKQHSPKYNILLKDDKGYHYIKITKNGWKNILAVKQRLDDGAEYIGPYTNSYGITNAIDSAKKIFLLPQCSKVFPRDYNKSRPCLNFFIGQCAAPCAGKTTAEAHEEAINQALDFIVNGSGKVIDALTEKMLEASENLEFEKAAKIRDKINAIKKVNEKQKVVAASVEEQDVFAVVCSDEKACLSVIRYRNAAKRGLEKAGIEENRYICVSVGIDGDPHITKANIDYNKCFSCGRCREICPHEAIIQESSTYKIKKERCLGCSICSKNCPTKAIGMESQLMDYDEVLPKLIAKGIDCIEFHAISNDENDVDEKWAKINKLFDGMLCISLDRSELGDKRLVERVRRMIQNRTPYSTIIQADGIAMSGNDDEYGTTLQAVATAQLFQNSKLPIYIMMSGGTNTKSTELAKICGVKPHCVAIGSYARKIVKQYLDDIYENETSMHNAVKIANSLIDTSLENMK